MVRKVDRTTDGQSRTTRVFRGVAEVGLVIAFRWNATFEHKHNANAAFKRINSRLNAIAEQRNSK